MSSLRIVAVQHEDEAPPGLLGDWARTRGLDLEVVRPDRGQALPEPSDPILFAAVLGSASSVTDCSVPWLERELGWLARAHTLGVAVLGICFGAQVLAAALGGTVRRAPQPELGWVEVTATSGGVSWPALTPGPWFAWHEDTLEPPPGASVLAHNRSGPQAYSLGRHLAVQFHPEVTAAIACRWIEHAHSDFPGSQIDAHRLRRDTAHAAGAAARRAHAMFDGFATRLER